MDLRKVIKDILKENEGIIVKDLKERDFDIDALFQKKTDKIITFTGFRRVGKTYLLFLIKKRLKEKFCIYFNFEDERLPESTEVWSDFFVCPPFLPTRGIFSRKPPPWTRETSAKAFY